MTDKIHQLHIGEERIRSESLRRSAACSNLSAHLELLESSMDVIYVLLPLKGDEDADRSALGNLGIRMFNALAASLKLLLSGYYQAAALHLRDVLETTFLIDYFSTDASLIGRWRTVPEGQRKIQFRPVTIRKALDDRDGYTELKRAKAYDLLCSLAGHATPEGVVMLIPVRGANYVHCGPFLENTALEAVLSEAAKIALQAAEIFDSMMENQGSEILEEQLRFAKARAAWIEKFFRTNSNASEP